MGNNPINKIDPNGGHTDDWYEILDAEGNGTGEYEWFDGSFDIEGYKHIGYNMTVNSRDIDGNVTLRDFRGDTKSAYLYNSETANFEFLQNYDKTSFVTDYLLSYVNGVSVASDQFSGTFVVGFQGAFLALYEGGIKGKFNSDRTLDIFGREGYEPLLNMKSTTIYNNGKWVKTNIHSNGDQNFAKEFAISAYKTASLLRAPGNISKGWEWIKNKF